MRRQIKRSDVFCFLFFGHNTKLPKPIPRQLCFLILKSFFIYDLINANLNKFPSRLALFWFIARARELFAIRISTYATRLNKNTNAIKLIAMFSKTPPLRQFDPSYISFLNFRHLSFNRNHFLFKTRIEVINVATLTVLIDLRFRMALDAGLPFN